MPRPGCAVWLLRRPDGSYLVRTSGRVSARTHELAWAATLPTPEAAQASAERLAAWDRGRLDALAQGDRLLCREACDELAWRPAEAALLERLATCGEPGLAKLAGALAALDGGAVAAAERALARSGTIDPAWAEARYPASMPVQRACFLLHCGLQAALVAALKAGDVLAAERAGALAPLPLALCEGPLPAG